MMGASSLATGAQRALAWPRHSSAQAGHLIIHTTDVPYQDRVRESWSCRAQGAELSRPLVAASKHDAAGNTKTGPIMMSSPQHTPSFFPLLFLFSPLGTDSIRMVDDDAPLQE